MIPPDPDAPVPKRIPKYKAPDFMAKEIELWARASNAMVSVRRNGDNDDPITPISPIANVAATYRVTEIQRAPK